MKKIIVIGAGLNGVKFLKEIGEEHIECFADNSENKQGTLVEGKKVISIEEIPNIYRNYILVISPNNYHEIINQIREMGCREYIVYANPLLSCAEEKQIPESSLYTPTMIKKCGEKYFIVDCWHHRILYSDILDFSVDCWSVFDMGLQNPHSIAFDGTYYVIDNTDKDEIKVYEKKENDFQFVSSLHLAGRPHKVVYSTKMNRFLVLLSKIPAIAITGVDKGKAKLNKIVEWDIPNIYCRSIKIIDDALFLISSERKIFKLDYENETLALINSYTMPLELYGMADLECWNGKWLISNYTNEKGEIESKIVYSESLENIESGRYKYFDAGTKGVPYFFEKIDSSLYITMIDRESAILKVVQNDENLFGEILYNNSVIDGADLLTRFANERSNVKKIGGVTLDYRYYFGEDMYSDGEIEDVILDAYKNDSIEELIKKSVDWPIIYHFSDLRRNLLLWMKDNKDSSVLEIGAGMGAITQVLSEKFRNVECIELSEKRSMVNAYRNKCCDNIKITLGNFQDIEPYLGTYDYITLIGVLEYAALYVSSDNPYLHMLKLVRKHLKHDGQLILAIENKLGLKYFNGINEDHTGIPYEGLNDYCSTGAVRTFSKKELAQMIKDAGFEDMKFYYPYPDYKLPTEIFSDKYLPKAGDLRSNDDNWAEPQIINFKMDTVWDQICEENLFPQFSNSFLIFANGEKESVVYAKYNPKRQAKFSAITIIAREDNITYVEKRAGNMLAENHIGNIFKKENMWRKLNFPVDCVLGNYADSSYKEPFLEGERVDHILYRMRYSRSVLLMELKKIVIDFLIPNNDLIDFFETSSFKNFFGNYNIVGEKSNRITNVDGSFCNMIKVTDGSYKYIDCEWIVDFPVPYQYPAWRAVRRFYYQYYESLKNNINLPKLFEILGISEKKQAVFEKMERHFMEATIDMQRVELFKRYSKPIWTKNK